MTGRTPPPPGPLGEPEERISLREARFWAERSGMVLKTPNETKDRFYWKILMDEPRWDSDTLDYHVGMIQLIYSSRPDINLDELTLESLLASGSFVIHIWDGRFDEGVGFRISCLYNETMASLMWVEDETSYNILASARHFSEADVYEIGESMGLG